MECEADGRGLLEADTSWVLPGKRTGPGRLADEIPGNWQKG